MLSLLFGRKRLNAIKAVAERLARGEHDARVKDPGHDELAKLANALDLIGERFAHDIAELKRLEAVRKEFVANVSHELRTPLSSIAAFAETLSAGGVSEAERAEFLKEIERAAERMTKLVDDLLNLSALESGKQAPKFEPLDLLGPTAEVVAAIKPLAAKKGVVVRVEPFGDLPKVRADRGQLKQVLTNLLDNAIKYARENGVVRVAASAADGSVAVTVADDGPGIPDADLPRVFERFYRADKARSREQGGTGLGLAIVKHIVELHGGAVSVESAAGLGAKFRFTLPSL